MLSIVCVILTIKVKVGIPESFKVGWYPPKKTGSSHLNKIEFSPEQELIGITPQADSFKLKISHFLYLVFA